MAQVRIEWEFDHTKFMSDVRIMVAGNDRDKPGLRDIEAMTGVSASTFSRVDNGATIDLDLFLQICGRLNLTPGAYFKQVRWQRVED